MIRANVEAIRADLRNGQGEIRDLQLEVADIVQELGALARAEIELAKAETREQKAHLIGVAAWGGVALATTLVASVWVGLTATLVLGAAFPLWISSLTVTVAFSIAGGSAALAARSRMKQLSLLPRRTIHAATEDLSWVKRQLKSSSTSNAGETR